MESEKESLKLQVDANEKKVTEMKGEATTLREIITASDTNSSNVGKNPNQPGPVAAYNYGDVGSDSSDSEMDEPMMKPHGDSENLLGKRSAEEAVLQNQRYLEIQQMYKKQKVGGSGMDGNNNSEKRVVKPYRKKDEGVWLKILYEFPFTEEDLKKFTKVVSEVIGHGAKFMGSKGPLSDFNELLSDDAWFRLLDLGSTKKGTHVNSRIDYLPTNATSPVILLIRKSVSRWVFGNVVVSKPGFYLLVPVDPSAVPDTGMITSSIGASSTISNSNITKTSKTSKTSSTSITIPKNTNISSSSSSNESTTTSNFNNNGRYNTLLEMVQPEVEVNHQQELKKGLEGEDSNLNEVAVEEVLEEEENESRQWELQKTFEFTEDGWKDFKRNVRLNLGTKPNELSIKGGLPVYNSLYAADNWSNLLSIGFCKMELKAIHNDIVYCLVIRVKDSKNPGNENSKSSRALSWKKGFYILNESV